MEKSAKLGKLTLLNIILFGFIGQVAWAVENNFFNTFLFSFGGTTKDISTMVAASAVVAVVTTFVMGTLSDKLGRRKVFICAGYVAWGITVMAFAFISRENLGKLIGADPSSAAALSATVTTVIVMDCIMTFMGSTSNDSAFNAWITDITVPSNRAKTEGLLAILPVLALVIVTGVFGFIAGDDAQASDYATCFLGLGILVIICGIVGIFTIKDTGSGQKSDGNFFADLIYGFRPSVIKSHKCLYLSLACMGVYSIASQVFFPYIFIYIEHQINFETKITVPAVIIAAIVILAVIAGVLASILLMDKVGKARFAFPAVVLFIVGLASVYFAGSHLIKFLACAMLAVGGYGLLMILLNAAIRDFTPEDKAGQFQGVRMIFAVMLPMIIGPRLGAEVTERYSDTTYISAYGEPALVPSSHIFLVAAIVGAVILIPLFFLEKEWKRADNK